LLVWWYLACSWWGVEYYYAEGELNIDHELIVYLVPRY